MEDQAIPIKGIIAQGVMIALCLIALGFSLKVT